MTKKLFRVVLAVLFAMGPALAVADGENATVTVSGYADCPGSGYYCDSSGHSFTVTDSAGTRSFIFPTGSPMTIPVHAGSVTVTAGNDECFTTMSPGGTVSVPVGGNGEVTVGWEDIYPCAYS